MDEKEGDCKITGRIGNVINVGSSKFMPSEVQLVALEHSNILLVHADGVNQILRRGALGLFVKHMEHQERLER